MDDLSFGFALRFRDLVSAGVNKASVAVQKLWTATKQVSTSAATAATQTTLFTATTHKLGTAASRSYAAVSRGASSLVTWSNNAKAAANHTSFLGRALQGLALFFGTRFLLGGIVSVFQEGNKFEQAMANIGAVLDDNTIPNMAKLTEHARAVGRTTAFSAIEASEGMATLAQNSWTTAQIMGGLEPILHMAKGGMISLDRSAEVVMSTMSQFTMPMKTVEETAQSAKKVADTLSAAANASMQDISRLSMGMKHAGPIAATLGISIENTAAALGVFGNAGFTGEQSGVAFRNIMSTLITPSKNLDRALAACGKTMADVDPRVNDLNTVFSNLSPLLKRADLEMKLFGKRSGVQAIAFTQLVTKVNMLSSIKEQMARAATAMEIYNKKMATAEGSIEIFKNNLTDLRVELSDLAKPMQIGFIHSMIRGVQEIQKFLAKFKPVIQVFVDTTSHLFGNLGDAIKNCVSSAFPILKKIKNAAEKDMPGIIGPIVLWAEIMAIRIELFFSGMGKGFSEAWDVFKTVTGPFIDLLKPVIDYLFKMFGIVDEGGDKYRGFGRAIGFVVASLTLFGGLRWALGIPWRIISTVVRYGVELAITFGAPMVRLVQILMGSLGLLSVECAALDAAGILTNLTLKEMAASILGIEAALVWPIALIVIITGLIIGLIWYFREDIAKAMLVAWDATSAFLTEFWDSIVWVWDQIKESVNNFIETSCNMLTGLWEYTKVLFWGMVIAARSFFVDPVVALFRLFVKFITEDIWPPLEELFSGFIYILTPLFDWLGKKFIWVKDNVIVPVAKLIVDVWKSSMGLLLTVTIGPFLEIGKLFVKLFSWMGSDSGKEGSKAWADKAKIQEEHIKNLAMGADLVPTQTQRGMGVHNVSPIIAPTPKQFNVTPMDSDFQDTNAKYNARKGLSFDLQALAQQGKRYTPTFALDENLLPAGKASMITHSMPLADTIDPAYYDQARGGQKAQSPAQETTNMTFAPGSLVINTQIDDIPKLARLLVPEIIKVQKEHTARGR